MEPIRIFISSPGDVELERQIARRTIARLQNEFAGEPIVEPYYWEYEPMRLTADYQGQIPPTSSFDIVVCILWGRLGSALGPQHHRPDGSRYQSGTEYEFEDAARSFASKGVPDILVYRNRTEPLIKLRPAEERARQLAQFDALEAFLEKWTREGEFFKGAITPYSDLSQFEELLGEHLRKLIVARRPAERRDRRAADGATWQGSPFRGLQPFEFEHAPVFRGRTRAIQDVIGGIRRQVLARQAWTAEEAGTKPPPAFVLVSAMSGIGKSSLVRAGVLPLLTTPGVVEGIGLWRRAVMKPAGGVGGLFSALAGALAASEALPELFADGTTVSQVAEALRASPSGADMLVKGGLSQAAAKLRSDEERQLQQWEADFAAKGRPADAERSRRQRTDLRQRDAALALLVDQLEEIFTAGDKVAEAERDAFLLALDALARSGRVVVLATLRSDFFARAGEVHALAALTKAGVLYQLEPPISAELAQIIREPAQEAGLEFEKDEGGSQLDDILLAATQGDPAALPLLEFTLDQLYDRRDADGRLTYAAYRDLGGVEGALARRAEAEFAALTTTAQGSFGRVFGALVNLSEVRAEERPVRRRTAMSQFAADPATTELIEQFARARLLVFDKDATGERSVSVVHEAMFSHWNRLRDWIDQHRDLLRVRGRVETAAGRWEREGRPRDLLLPDGRLLAEAQDLLAHGRELSFVGPVDAFVAESAAAQRRRLYRRVAALVVLTVGVAVAAVISWYQYQSFTRNRLETKLFEYRQAVRDSESKFLSHGPAATAIKEALEVSQRVLRLIEEVKAIQGRPPEQWEDAAAKAHEFSAVLRTELGDAEGSLRELEARKALSTGAKGLGDVLQRNPAMMSYALVVFDLQLELFIANEHLKALLRQNELLKQALEERMRQEGAGSPAPTPTPGAAAPKLEDAREAALASLKIHQSLARILEYMTREFRRDRDYAWLGLLQSRVASLHETLEQRDEANQVWRDRIASARSRLDWARKTTFVPADEKKALVLNAAKDLVTAQQDLANFFYTRRKDYDQALRIAQEGLQIIDTEAELADAEEQRFALRKIVVNALVQLKRNEEALREAQTATAGMLGSSRKSLQDAWARAIKTHDDVAEYLSAIGIRSRAVAVAQQVVDVLEQEARSPFETAGPSVLAGAYTRLSWHQLLVRKFADAQGTVEKGLALAVSDVQKALLSAKLAHALLFQDGGERAREIYETWKAKPVETKEKDPTLFARVVLDDFGQLERMGLTHPTMPAIRKSMEAVLVKPKDAPAQPKPAN